MVYLALYKGKKTIKRPIDFFWRGVDKLIRVIGSITKSHSIFIHLARTKANILIGLIEFE